MYMCVCVCVCVCVCSSKFCSFTPKHTHYSSLFMGERNNVMKFALTERILALPNPHR